MKKRDTNILAHITGEVNLGNRVVKNKKVYTRKVKYRKSNFEF